MNKIFGRFLRLELSTEILLPVSLIAIYIAFLIILRGSMPSPQELIGHLTSLYERYGYEVVFLGAVLEALVIVNFFLPGGTVAALGAVFAKSGQLDLTYVILTAIAGAMVGYMIDFILGYLGFGKIIKRLGYGGLLTQSRARIEKSAVKTFALGCIHPNISSILSLASGTLRMNFVNFLTLTFLATAFWFSFWGLLTFAFGEILLTILSKYFFVLILLVLSIWVLTTFYGSIRKDN